MSPSRPEGMGVRPRRRRSGYHSRTGLPSGESRGCTLPAPHPGGGNSGGFWGRTILRRPGSTAEGSDETEDDAGRSGGTRPGARADGDCPVHPGAYEIPGYEVQKQWTVAELIAVAGGPLPGAALPKAIVMRKDTSIPVDLEQLIVEGNASANVSLNAGDVVIVPESKNKVVVMGGVLKPGPYRFREGDHE